MIKCDWISWLYRGKYIPLLCTSDEQVHWNPFHPARTWQKKYIYKLVYNTNYPEAGLILMVALIPVDFILKLGLYTLTGDPGEDCVVHLFIPAAEVILVDQPWDFLLHRIVLIITQRGFYFCAV